jgi:hypothetical protein
LTRAFSLIWLSFQGMLVMTSNSAAAPALGDVGGDARGLVAGGQLGQAVTDFRQHPGGSYCRSLNAPYDARFLKTYVVFDAMGPTRAGVLGPVY